ncbi:MAG: extracellular solute-binding protein [Clostridiaceae bacterium]|nr:extracellular solute-binding protein [Clostridiaceae bacterium]
MMKRYSKILSLLLAVVLLCSLAACAGNPTQSTAAPTTTGKSTTTTAPQTTTTAAPALEGKVVISVQAGTGVAEAWEAVAKAYEAINQKVDVVVDLKPSEGYDTWIKNMFGTESPEADLVAINLAGPAAKDKAINFMEYATDVSTYSGKPWNEQFNFEMQTKDLAQNEWTNISLESVQVLWCYNKDLFAKAGAKVPTTWDELIAACEKLQAAGIQPIACPGDFNSFWAMQMGWLAQIYADQTTRSMLDVYKAHDGDYCYDPDIDGIFKLDISDPFNDDSWKVNQNIVRAFKAISDGTYKADSDGMKTVWANFAKVFPKYAGGEAFFGTTDALPLFYQGKAAMYIDGAWRLPSFKRDMDKLAAGEDVSGADTDGDGKPDPIEGVQKFELGTFNMPSMAGAGIEAKARTIEVAVGFLGAVKKEKAHDDLVVDFLMFYSSKDGYSAYMKAGLENDWTPNGPPLVNDVELPAEYAAMFDNLSFIGNCQKGYGQMMARGAPGDVQESLREWYGYSQEFLSGDITIDQWAADHKANVAKYLDTAMTNSKVQKSDLDNPQNAPTGK